MATKLGGVDLNFPLKVKCWQFVFQILVFVVVNQASVAMEQAKHDAICDLAGAGHIPVDIIKLLKYNQKTACNVYNKGNVTGETKHKSHATRSELKRDTNFVST